MPEPDRAGFRPFRSPVKDNPSVWPYAGRPMGAFAPRRAGRLALAAILFASPMTAASKKRPTPTPTPTATPTPVPLLRAAGSCLRYEPGAYVVLSEVGQPGRAFLIDADTELTATPRRGSRLRILYEDRPEGPLARKILPGPEAEDSNKEREKN
jgi:hypothetical protein